MIELCSIKFGTSHLSSKFQTTNSTFLQRCYLTMIDDYFLAGVEGFEPPNAGTKTQCLTTWPHPNICVCGYIVTDLAAYA